MARAKNFQMDDKTILYLAGGIAALYVLHRTGIIDLAGRISRAGIATIDAAGNVIEGAEQGAAGMFWPPQQYPAVMVGEGLYYGVVQPAYNWWNQIPSGAMNPQGFPSPNGYDYPSGAMSPEGFPSPQPFFAPAI